MTWDFIFQSEISDEVYRGKLLPLITSVCYQLVFLYEDNGSLVPEVLVFSSDILKVCRVAAEL